MTAPRRWLPNATYLITRRTLLRQFLLRPTPKMQEILFFVMARVAFKTGVEIHGWVYMSNHVHLVVTDTQGRLSDFLRAFFKTTSSALNKLYGRKGQLWDGVRPDVRRLMDSATILRYIDYTLANPVKAGLVRKLEDWEGSVSLPSDLGKTLAAQRPKTYFRQSGSRALPEVIELQVTRPPSVECSDEEYIEGRKQNLARAEEAARREFKRVLGRRRCEREKITTVPNTPAQSAPPGDGFMCEDHKSRDLHRKQLREWRAAYRKAWLRHRENGIPLAEAGFPDDSWRLVCLRRALKKTSPPS
jgi:putative transposase